VWLPTHPLMLGAEFPTLSIKITFHKISPFFSHQNFHFTTTSLQWNSEQETMQYYQYFLSKETLTECVWLSSSSPHNSAILCLLGHIWWKLTTLPSVKIDFVVPKYTNRLSFIIRWTFTTFRPVNYSSNHQLTTISSLNFHYWKMFFSSCSWAWQNLQFVSQ
jgi:hypothetical protein